jgi:hypothetical protein
MKCPILSSGTGTTIILPVNCHDPRQITVEIVDMSSPFLLHIFWSFRSPARRATDFHLGSKVSTYGCSRDKRADMAIKA